MRRYDEPIAVEAVTAEGSGDASSLGETGVPSRFLWRGRLYVVRGILSHWVELGAWWRQRDREGLPLHVDGQGRHIWRVEARAGASSIDGVYDLAHDRAHDAASSSGWSLTRAHD